MDFPLVNLMDEDVCYAKLLDILHPDGLGCPRCCRSDHLAVHRWYRRPVLDYHCKACGRVFNAFTGTVFQGTHRSCAELLLILRGIAHGVPTAQLARELGRNRPRLLELRHGIQANAMKHLDKTPLTDAVAEVDEMYQNAGEKRQTALGSSRSAATSGQQHKGPRHVGKRPTAGVRRRRSSERLDPPGGGAPQRPGHALPASS